MQQAQFRGISLVQCQVASPVAIVVNCSELYLVARDVFSIPQVVIVTANKAANYTCQ